ncbi:MAG: OsmC family protein [Anaerolineaceae bacterium]|nr:OsmC family protein [Anaerolineaceae bacterium]
MPPVSVTLRDSLQATIQCGHHTWLADEPLDSGGTDTGPTPMQTLLGALGSCIAITMKLYAQRKEWPLEGVDVELEIQRFKGSDYPGYEGTAFVHEIRKKITLHGPLDDEQRSRIHDIGEMCPVHRTLQYPTVFVEKE